MPKWYLFETPYLLKLISRKISFFGKFSFHGKNSILYLISRLCHGCEQTFQTRRGLQSHSKRASPASLCRRYGDQKIKFAKIKANNERRYLAKNIKPSEVDLESWDGKIKKGTTYDTNSKTLCLNAIKVSKKRFSPLILDCVRSRKVVVREKQFWIQCQTVSAPCSLIFWSRSWT